MASVSFVLPVYKVEKYLEMSVSSLLRQTGAQTEIILVDDGSPDNSGAICDDMARRHDNIRVIHQKNAGSGYARNTGMDAATGDYICFVDPDDYIDDNLLADNVPLAEATHADIVVFGHHIIYENRDGSVLKTEAALPRLEGNYTYGEFLNNLYEFWLGNPATVWGKLFRRDYLVEKKLHFGNQSVGQDAIFCLDVYETGFERITFVKKPYYEHILREGSAVDRYHPNRYVCELNIAEKLDRFLDRINALDGNCRYLAAERYIRVLSLEAGNLCKTESNMSLAQKRGRLSGLAAKPRIAWALKTLPASFYNGSKSKTLQLYMLKAHMFYAVLGCKTLIRKKNWK